MKQAQKLFVIGIIIAGTLSFSGSYILGNMFDEVLVKVDCNEINERPDDFIPKGGTIEEKFANCNNWNEIVKNNEYIPMMIRVMMMLPFFFYLWLINSEVGIMNIIKNKLDDDMR